MVTYTYSDIDLAFNMHPIRADINKLTDAAAIRASVRNLVLTNKNEVPFQPEIGSSVRSLMFENQSPLIDAAIAEAIKEVIDNYERRVTLNSVDVNFDHRNNGYNITVVFTIRAFNTTGSISVFLGR